MFILSGTIPRSLAVKIFPLPFHIARRVGSSPGPARSKDMNHMIAARMTVFFVLSVTPLLAASKLETREVHSVNFAQSKIATSPVRKMVVYLPAGYDDSSKRYPVVYFFPNSFGSYRDPFDHKGAQGIFDRAIEAGIIEKFILVSVDMNTSIGSSWCVNSPATGNWEDFVMQELTPYIDGNFKTMPNRNSRGIAGEFMGGYCALRLGMEHPEVFGSVYALHPVGTGSGLKVLASIPNLDLMANAQSLDDVKKDGGSTIFASIFQAHLPDADKPPLFIDLPAHKTGDQLIIDSRLMQRLRDNFFIESMVPRYADNLKSLRGLKFDWGRSDSNQDHVYSNQALTHKLNEFGIAHEAEEYNGVFGEKNWLDDGRIYDEVLPFFQKHLVFDAK
jgi:Putative esterase